MSVLIQVSSYKKPLLVLLEYLELRSVFYEMYSISECPLIVNSYSNNVILLVLIYIYCLQNCYCLSPMVVLSNIISSVIGVCFLVNSLQRTCLISS